MKAASPSCAIPPHTALTLPGVHGYASAKSVRAGDTIGFHISADRPYRFAVCRLGSDVETRSNDVVVADFGSAAPCSQDIHPGSYIHVQEGLDAASQGGSLSFEMWIKRWETMDRQCIVSQGGMAGDEGWAIFLEQDGGISLNFGDVEVFSTRSTQSLLSKGRWHHLVVTWNATTASLYLDAVNVGRWEHTLARKPGRGPIRIGAFGNHGLASMFLDADIAMPVLYQAVLEQSRVAARFKDQGLTAAKDADVLGCWPLQEERGDQTADAGGWHRDGRIVNHATWMILGPAFDGAHVDVYASYDPFADPSRGHALRLASDDLYDCRWNMTHSYQVPADARQGVYVGRLRFALDEKLATYEITFIVSKRAGQASAPILVLCACSTWLAYAATPFPVNTVDDPIWPRRSAGLENSHPDAPNYCSYTFHRAGQPCYQVGLRMPWPNASPNALYDPAGSGFSQWTRLERRLHVWLEQEGYDFDVLSDIDLYREPQVLGHYKTVFVNGHSEYWSSRALLGLDTYLKHGGSALVLSGNTMFLRVSFDDELSVMEQRKVNPPGLAEATVSLSPPAGVFGEQYHSQDGARGGRFKEFGLGAADVVGLETAGWAFADAEDFGVYHVSQPDHFLFNTPNKIGLALGETFGHGPGGSLPRAIGHEWDLTVATLSRVTFNIPNGARLPEPAHGMTVIAEGRRDKAGRTDAYLDYFSNETKSMGGLSAEMIYWDRPQGGRVFHAGAVGAAWVIGVDPKFEILLKNVLHHFGVTAPLHRNASSNQL